MAIITTLELAIKGEQSCDGKYLYLSDITGLSAISGDKLWNDPSGIDISDVTQVYFTVTDPNGDTYTFNPWNTSTGVSDWDPNGAIPNSTPYQITYDMLGGTVDTIIPDGQYYIGYYVTNTAGDQTAPTYIFSFLHSQITCCVYGMFATLSDESCDCNDTGVDKALKAWAYYKALILSVKLAQLTKAGRLLTALQRLCNYSGSCKSCS